MSACTADYEQVIYEHKRNVVILQVISRMFWVIWSSD